MRFELAAAAKLRHQFCLNEKLKKEKRRLAEWLHSFIKSICFNLSANLFNSLFSLLLNSIPAQFNLSFLLFAALFEINEN